MGQGGGPLMTMKDSLFLLTSNVSGKECGAGTGPTNADEEFFVSSDFKCFLGSVGPEGGPLMMMKDSSFLLISNVLGRECGAWEGAQ